MAAAKEGSAHDAPVSTATPLSKRRAVASWERSKTSLTSRPYTTAEAPAALAASSVESPQTVWRKPTKNPDPGSFTCSARLGLLRDLQEAKGSPSRTRASGARRTDLTTDRACVCKPVLLA